MKGFGFLLLSLLLRRGLTQLTLAHPAKPAHPDWRVSRSHARRSDIFPPGREGFGARIGGQADGGTPAFEADAATGRNDDVLWHDWFKQSFALLPLGLKSVSP